MHAEFGQRFGIDGRKLGRLDLTLQFLAFHGEGLVQIECRQLGGACQVEASRCTHLPVAMLKFRRQNLFQLRPGHALDQYP